MKLVTERGLQKRSGLLYLLCYPEYAQLHIWLVIYYATAVRDLMRTDLILSPTS